MCSVILQRELLNLQIPFATFVLLFLPCFFKIVLIVDLAIPYSALSSPTRSPLFRLEIIYFLTFRRRIFLQILAHPVFKM